MQQHRELLNTPEAILGLSKILSQEPVIALDTEFIRETTFYPIIALIQVATEKESWLVDPLAVTAQEIKPLLDVFENPKILKILHAAQADQECLCTNYGVVAAPSFDTAVGASLCGYGESIGLSKLLKEAMNVNLPKGHARTDWTVRPMPEQLASYAHQDVQYLIALAKKLFAQLEPKGRKEWALELTSRMERKANYEPNPDGIAAKLAKSGRVDRRGFAILRELIDWRERRVREADVPRRRIADDDVLMDLAAARPKDMTHLSAFRGLNKGEFKHSGQAILAAVKKGMMVPDDQLKDVPRPPIPTPEESRVIELVNCFVKILAEDLEITARHLITADDVVSLLRGKFNSVDEIVKAGLLTEGAARLIGEEFLAMIQGRRGLSVKDGQVFIRKLD